MSNIMSNNINNPIQLPCYPTSKSNEKTGSDANATKAVLDLTRIETKTGGDPTYFNLGNATKFNVVIPPGSKVTLHFPLTEPATHGETSRIVTLTNDKNQPARLVSFTFDTNGSPRMRAANKDGIKKSVPLPQNQPIDLSNPKAQFFSKLLSDNNDDKKRNQKYADYALGSEFTTFKDAIEADKNKNNQTLILQHKNTQDKDKQHLDYKEVKKIVREETSESSSSSIKTESESDTQSVYYDALTGDEDQNINKSVNIEVSPQT